MDTDQLMVLGVSDRGSWSRAQLELLGVEWPLVSGWKDRLPTTVPDRIAERFLFLKNAHLALKTRHKTKKLRKFRSLHISEPVQVIGPGFDEADWEAFVLSGEMPW